MAGAQRGAGHRDAVEAGGIGALLDRAADRPRADPRDRQVVPIADAREQRTRSRRPNLQPSVECPDRIGRRMVAAGDSDDLGARVLSGLGPADGQQDAGWLAEDVVGSGSPS